MTSFESYQLKPTAGLGPEKHLEDIDKFVVQARDHLNSLLAEQLLLRQILNIETIGLPAEEPQVTALSSVITAA
jgi:hypothetical protein